MANKLDCSSEKADWAALEALGGIALYLNLKVFIAESNVGRTDEGRGREERQSFAAGLWDASVCVEELIGALRTEIMERKHAKVVPLER